MELATVVGTVNATMKDGGLSGMKLLVVQRVDGFGAPIGDVEVATDTQGAGVGDLVLLLRGSAARQPEATRSKPTDLTIVAVVDHVQMAAGPATSTTVTPPPSQAPTGRTRTTRSKS